MTTTTNPTRNIPATLWACSWNETRLLQARTIRALRYCSKLFNFERIVLFSYLPPTGPQDFPLEFVQIPHMDMGQFCLFHVKLVPLLIRSDFAMAVHEDGFPLDASLWRDDFLAYDYIGAPWVDGIVGNGGFCIESRNIMQAKLKLPFMLPPLQPSDTFVCRTHRTTLAGQGIKFAPVELAVKFSTEQTGKKWPSFGFHGRIDQPEKYARGWKLIEESEK